MKDIRYMIELYLNGKWIRVEDLWTSYKAASYYARKSTADKYRIVKYKLVRIR